MKRSNLIKYGLTVVTASTALLGVGGTAQAAAAKKPNILILWGDDIGTWNISYNNRGMMGYQTPNIDRIAKEGVAFTQQTFLSAVEHLAGFREEASFSTWLLRIASHAALKVIRKRKGLDTVSLEEATEVSEGVDSIPHPEFIADWRQSPEELVQRNETRRLLDEALALLDEKHRLVFLLRDVEGLSVKETAEALDLSEANVKVRLLRARLQLREQLTRTLGDPERRLVKTHDYSH
jgi:RNA polymerase sigma-70 factor (ECF subfamily)